MKSVRVKMLTFPQALEVVLARYISLQGSVTTPVVWNKAETPQIRLSMHLTDEREDMSAGTPLMSYSSGVCSQRALGT